MKFIEAIGQYTDMENLDMMINVSMIKLIRPDPQLPNETIVQFVGEEETTRVCEPYAEVRRRILEATR